MAEFLNAVSAVFLLFSLMAVGYFLGVFGWLGIVLGAIAYASCKWLILPDWAFLDRMAVSFLFVCLCGLVLTLVNAARGGEAVVLTDKGIIEIKPSTKAKVFGAVVIVLTVALYILFW